MKNKAIAVLIAVIVGLGILLIKEKKVVKLTVYTFEEIDTRDYNVRHILMQDYMKENDIITFTLPAKEMDKFIDSLHIDYKLKNK